MDNKTGQAYGFFKCGATKREIKEILPFVRSNVETSSNLELSLIEGLDNLEGDEKLTFLAQGLKRVGVNYVLQATYPDGTNEDAANEVADIFGQIALSEFYETSAHFNGAIVHEDGKVYEDGKIGNYVFRD